MTFPNRGDLLLQRILLLLRGLVSTATYILFFFRNAMGTLPGGRIGRGRSQPGAFLAEAAGAGGAAEELIVFGSVAAASVAPVSGRHDVLVV